MSEFLFGSLNVENIALLTGIIFGGIAMLLFQVFTVKLRVRGMDKKMINKGLPPMTDDVKEIVTKACRAEAIELTLSYMFAMLIGITALHFIFR